MYQRDDDLFKNPGDPITEITTKYEYDKNSRQVKITDPRNNSTTFTYDAANRLKKVEDAAGNKVEYTLDSNGNVTKVIRTDKSQLSSSYDETIIIDYAYDQLNRITSETLDPGEGKLNITTSYKYDSRSNILEITDGEGNKTKNYYDGLNRKTRAEIDRLSGSPPILSTTQFEYVLNSNLTKITDDNNNYTTFVYDDLDRRKSETWMDSTQKTYTYDLSHNIYTRTDANATTTTYTYDALNRVTHKSVSRGTGVEGTTFEDYVYDALGRITTAKDDDSIVTFKYDSLNRIYETSQSVGNPASVTRTIKYEYDNASNVTKITYPDNTAIDYVQVPHLNLVDKVKQGINVIADYTYVGYRVSKRSYLNGTDTFWSYDAIGRVSSLNHKKNNNKLNTRRLAINILTTITMGISRRMTGVILIPVILSIMIMRTE